MAAILLIDDNPVQLRAREAVLRHAGFDTRTATTQESALALLHSKPALGAPKPLISKWNAVSVCSVI